MNDFVSNDFVSNEIYCIETREKIFKHIHNMPPSMSPPVNFPWDDTYNSDHLPILGCYMLPNTKKVLKFGTFNVLNRKYIKYMQPEPNNQLLGQHPMANPSINIQLNREKNIRDQIKMIMEANECDILCLQEVSYTLYQLLKTEYAHILKTRLNISSDGFDNCNLIIFNSPCLSCTNNNILIPDEYTDNKTLKIPHTMVFTFTYTDPITSVQDIFQVASLHLSYSTTQDYAKIIMSYNNVYPLVLCGDMNRGVKDSADNMHMNTYNDPCFMFPNPSSDINKHPYSHVCHFKNVGGADYRQMLDKFDHIFIKIPNIK